MPRDGFSIVVHVLLEQRRGSLSEVLLLRRRASAPIPAVYAPPGGHLRTGERVEDAAQRECLEETGVTTASLRPVCVLPYRMAPVAGLAAQGVNFVFAASGWQGEPAVCEPDCHDALAWFGVNTLPDNAVPWLETVFELRDAGEWYREFH